ncbi:MAG TPA: aspartate kinase, partial [Burkholderiales bacterium]
MKLGGSLASDPSQLQRWLSMLATEGAGKVVIVPGGGPYADLVRESQAKLGFSDSTAHRMAILAMEQFALTLVALAPGLTPADSAEGILGVLGQGGVPVWLPGIMTIGNPEIPESWDVSSDSLAAWLARRLGAERLVLVKSCAVPGDQASSEELRRLGIVDAAFPEFMRGTGFPVL